MLIAQITDLHMRPSGKTAYRVVDTNMLRAAIACDAAAASPMSSSSPATSPTAAWPRSTRCCDDCLKPLPMPVFWSPATTTGATTSEGVFRRPTIAADGDFVHFVVDDHPMRLIGLDTVVEKWSAGALCERRLKFLSMRSKPNRQRPTVVFMHHPPFDCGIRHMDRIRLLDGSAELAAILKRHRQVLGLWCGHNHRAIETVFGGVPASIIAGVAHR